jgi:TM2 domain-containing membrane protein YozV
VRAAGAIVAIQGVVALVVAAVLVVRGITGAHQHMVNGLGTAVLFVLFGGVVLAAGRALTVGKRWGRGLAVITQLLLLPVAWYLVRGSQQPAAGIPAGVVALAVLALLFTPAAVRWAAAGDQGDPAAAANRAPDSQ